MYLPKFLINFVVRHSIQKKIDHLSDVTAFRRYMNAVGRKSSRLPKDVKINTHATTPEIITLTPPSPEPDQVILYLHGGGYVFGSFSTHGMLMAKLGTAAQCPVVHVDYALAPEYPFPAALTDAMFAYDWVRKNYPGARIFVGGDSAGAGLTLSLLQKLRADKVDLPAKIFLYSPWADLTGTSLAVKNNAKTEHMLSQNGLHTAADAYAPGRDLRDPLLSPVHADFAGFPDMLVQFVPHEILADDARTVIAKARAADVAVTATEWPGNAHAFQTLGNLRDADRAIAETAAFLRG
jgi:epsilon-lactone hydrolase